MKSDHLEIKRCTIEDLPELQQLSIQTFRETYEVFNTAENMRLYVENDLSKEQLKKEIQNADVEFYLVESDGSAIGFVKLNFISHDMITSNLRGLEIERIYILKSFQFKGIGYFILKKVETMARSRNLDYIWLSVWEHNLKARAFYERNGFEEFGRQVFYLGNDKQDDLLVRKFIDRSEND